MITVDMEKKTCKGIIFWMRKHADQSKVMQRRIVYVFGVFFWNRNVYSYQTELPSRFEGNEKNMIFRMRTPADQSRVIKTCHGCVFGGFFLHYVISSY